MSKDENKVNFKVTIDMDSIQSAMRNAPSVQEAILDVPIIDPKKLCIDDEIFGVKLAPITYENGIIPPKEPNAIMYPSINAVKVHSLTKSAVENHITVNGSIDMPTATGRTAKIGDTYLQTEDQARLLSKIMVEVQLEKLEEQETRLAHEKQFLLKQKADNRF